jgi:hypothetical protein
VRRVMRALRGIGGRGVWCAVATVAVAAAPPAAVAAPGGGEAPRVPFTERFDAVQHGGIARAANASVTCGTGKQHPADTCEAVRAGAGGRNDEHRMTYIDVDRDRNTYNSSSATLRMPAGSKVSHARLYWGGNLRAGEQKQARDNGRVLLAEQGGRYKEVRADSVVGHTPAPDADGYTASADVTSIVRTSGPGRYTVGQVNVAKGRSAAGAWGGWTLVVAYENRREPLRHLVMWDGHESVEEGTRLSVAVRGLRMPPAATGTVGFVAHGGDRGATGDALRVRPESSWPVALHDAANPENDVMNSTITDLGRPAPGRVPAHANTLGYDSDVLDLSPALLNGPRRLDFRFDGGSEGYQVSALWMQAQALPRSGR